METSRKKALAIMQKGIVSYKLSNMGWDVSDHFGDGCDLIAEKKNRFIKIELKAIDLSAIQEGKNATQHLSVNEIVTSTHLIITVFDGIEMKSNYIMCMRQFIVNSGVEKYKAYSNYKTFIYAYIQFNNNSLKRKKNSPDEKKRLDFDFNFNPHHPDKWRMAKFKEKWINLEQKKQLKTASIILAK